MEPGGAYGAMGSIPGINVHGQMSDKMAHEACGGHGAGAAWSGPVVADETPSFVPFHPGL